MIEHLAERDEYNAAHGEQGSGQTRRYCRAARNPFHQGLVGLSHTKFALARRTIGAHVVKPRSEATLRQPGNANLLIGRRGKNANQEIGVPRDGDAQFLFDIRRSNCQNKRYRFVDDRATNQIA
jgi:hypothetical protein